MIPEHLTHLARDRLGPGGELFRACDGGPLDPLPPLYEKHDNSPDAPGVRLVFCVACVAVARCLGLKREVRRDLGR
jgi:hypothetical protein